MAPDDRPQSLGERALTRVRETPGTEVLAAVLFGAVGAALGYFSWFIAPGLNPFGTIATLVLVAGGFLGAVAGWELLESRTEIATVEIDGEIRRDASKHADGRIDADRICEAIEDADDSADGLLVAVNSPGGEPVPSEDIRRAIKAFDGPTVASAEDLCASGGYLIASGCDHVYAREGGMIGSIGVVGSKLNYSDLIERLGISYERLTAGEYKDAGVPVAEMDEDERDYLQTLIDEHYEIFVERVAEERGLDVEAVTDTEARVFSGRSALEIGLVDALGDRDDAEAHLTEQFGGEVDTDAVRSLDITPRRGPLPQLATAPRRIAYSLGAGVADRIAQLQSDRFSIEFK